VTRASGSIMMLLEEEPSAVSFGVPSNINGEDGRAEGYETFEVRYAEGRGYEVDERGVAVVGSDLVTKLDAEVGGEIEVRGETFEVVGILEKTLTAPTSQSREPAGRSGPLRRVAARSCARHGRSARSGDVDRGLSRRRSRSRCDGDRDRGGIPDIAAMGPEGFQTSVQEPLQIFNQIIYAVAFISLAVGGLSVINTMTMSVAERTREIGVRKAIGASDGAIMRQFVAESAVMGLFGGLAGLLVGWGIVIAANNAGAATATELFLITPRLAVGAVAFAVFLGVIAGLYPAWHAARLNPCRGPEVRVAPLQGRGDIRWNRSCKSRI
jgi:putative ABC transport system permease protein